jgi:hypothetical protein
MVPDIVLLSSEQTRFVEWTVAEGVILDAKAQAGDMSDFPNSRPFVFGRELGIYSHLVFSSVTAVQDVP